MGNPSIQFQFAPSADPKMGNDGWAQGSLYIDGAPFWYAHANSDPKLIEWTWVDLLEHVAISWAELIAEQTYPFPWLSLHVAHPGEMWKVAQERWRRAPNELVDEEEPSLLAFIHRHNLSAAWKGMGLPSLLWHRIGNNLWLIPEAGIPIRTSFEANKAALEDFCNKLADAFEHSTNERVIAATDMWRKRYNRLHKDFIALNTGLATSTLAQIQLGIPANDYWEIGEQNAHEEPQDNELLAAARMSPNAVTPLDIAQILNSIRKLAKVSTPYLDQLSEEALQFMSEKQDLTPYEAGYALASWFRQKQTYDEQRHVDIKSLLRIFGVTQTSENLKSEDIDAIAIWGRRGPAVILNSVSRYADNLARMRMTLSHELCHLLIDRHNALPACDVLGGVVDRFVESRANAFAAELLLPRIAAENIYRKIKSLREALTYLIEHYAVSKTVAAMQLHNSQTFFILNENEQQYLAYRTKQIQVLPEKIASRVV